MKYLSLVIFLFLSPLTYSQVLKKQTVIDRLEGYIEKDYWINNNHTNKWQNNYWTHDGYDHSTFIDITVGETIYDIEGAPYGYGLKDLPSEMESKIDQGEFFDLDTLGVYYRLYFELANPDTMSRKCSPLIITSPRYCDYNELDASVFVDNPAVSWKLSVYNVQYVVGPVVDSNKETPIWSSEWFMGDTAWIPIDGIEYTGKYVVKMQLDEASLWGTTLNATVTIDVPMIMLKPAGLI